MHRIFNYENRLRALPRFHSRKAPGSAIRRLMAESLVKQVGSNFQPSAFSKSDDYKAKLRADS